jgi:hypothetical protein
VPDGRRQCHPRRSSLIEAISAFYRLRQSLNARRWLCIEGPDQFPCSTLPLIGLRNGTCAATPYSRRLVFDRWRSLTPRHATTLCRCSSERHEVATMQSTCSRHLLVTIALGLSPQSPCLISKPLAADHACHPLLRGKFPHGLWSLVSLPPCHWFFSSWNSHRGLLLVCWLAVDGGQHNRAKCV